MIPFISHVQNRGRLTESRLMVVRGWRKGEWEWRLRGTGHRHTPEVTPVDTKWVSYIQSIPSPQTCMVTHLTTHTLPEVSSAHTSGVTHAIHSSLLTCTSGNISSQMHIPEITSAHPDTDTLGSPTHTCSLICTHKWCLTSKTPFPSETHTRWHTWPHAHT